MANKIRLTVGGIEYPIVTDDDEVFVQKIGAELNRALNKIAKLNPKLSTTMVAVLTALNYCDCYEKQRMQNETLKQQLKTASDEASCAKIQSEEAHREIERLNMVISDLRKGQHV